MNQVEDDAALDTLLSAGLAPPSRAPDQAFVAAVGAAIREGERYRRWRAGFRRRLITDLLTFGGLAGALAILSRAPVLSEIMTRAPAFAWPIPILLFLGWVSLNRGAKGRTFLS